MLSCLIGSCDELMGLLMTRFECLRDSFSSEFRRDIKPNM